MREKQEGSARLAGLMLALIGVFTYGSTSPFGLVLCCEWLCDPNRTRSLRRWDWLGLVLAMPGTLFFVVLSVGLFTYAPGGFSFAGMIGGYWLGFLIWSRRRSRTRWSELGWPLGGAVGLPVAPNSAISENNTEDSL
jgi:threonine/homoserine efflux transporter RhtA